MDQADVIARLFTDNSRRQVYERGDVIIRAGDTPSGVYLITDGWVEVYNLCHDGEQNIIMSLRDGDIFPLEWIIADILHEVNFAALETTSVLRMSKDYFRRKLQANPWVAQAALLKLCHYFLQLSSELEHLPYRSARERVAFRLVSLAKYFGVTNSDQVMLKLPIPNEFIARSSNMTRETASREISWLTRKGYIERQNGCIVIKNLPALRREIGKSFQLPSD